MFVFLGIEKVSPTAEGVEPDISLSTALNRSPRSPSVETWLIVLPPCDRVPALALGALLLSALDLAKCCRAASKALLARLRAEAALGESRDGDMLLLSLNRLMEAPSLASAW